LLRGVTGVLQPIFSQSPQWAVDNEQYVICGFSLRHISIFKGLRKSDAQHGVTVGA